MPSKAHKKVKKYDNKKDKKSSRDVNNGKNNNNQSGYESGNENENKNNEAWKKEGTQQGQQKHLKQTQNQRQETDFSANSDFIAFNEDYNDYEAPNADNNSSITYGTRKRAMSFSATDSRSKRSKQDITRMTPWLKNVNWDNCTDGLSTLHEEILAFANYIKPKKAEHELRTRAIQTVTNLIKNILPDSEVYPFGSYTTKLYLPDGDVDLVILNRHVSKRKFFTVSSRLANAIKQRGIGKSVNIIGGARVPIIKFICTIGDFPFDLSFNQTPALDSSDVVTKHLNQVGYPLACTLVFLLKILLDHRGVNEVYSGGLSSYSAICLVISFLQMHPKIQSREWDPERNLGIAFIELLQLYGLMFNFDECGISISNGGKYFSKKSRGWHQHQQPFLISIEDPADPEHDISSGSKNVRSIRMHLAGAHEVLTTSVIRRDEFLQQNKVYNDSISELIEGHLEPVTNQKYQSILGSIISLEKKDVNARNSKLEKFCDINDASSIKEQDDFGLPSQNTTLSSSSSLSKATPNNDTAFSTNPDPKIINAETQQILSSPKNHNFNGGHDFVPLDGDSSDASQHDKASSPDQITLNLDSSIDGDSRYTATKNKNPKLEPKIVFIDTDSSDSNSDLDSDSVTVLSNTDNKQQDPPSKEAEQKRKKAIQQYWVNKSVLSSPDVVEDASP